MNIYVGNLSHQGGVRELREAFETHGQVTSAVVIKDRYTGESRGFGFVEMSAKSQGRAAMSALNGTEMKGRTLTINEARPRGEQGSVGHRGGWGPGGNGSGRGRR